MICQILCVHHCFPGKQVKIQKRQQWCTASSNEMEDGGAKRWLMLQPRLLMHLDLEKGFCVIDVVWCKIHEEAGLACAGGAFPLLEWQKWVSVFLSLKFWINFSLGRK